MSKALFSLGQTVITPGAAEAVELPYVLQCITRHLAGDWGVVDAEDKATNNSAVRHGMRILSAYPIDPEKECKGFGANTIWIITESDRSVTTILLPDEY